MEQGLIERVNVISLPPDLLNWDAKWAIRKYDGNFRSEEEALRRGAKHYEELLVDGNGLLNNGINFLLNRLITATPDTTYPPWNNANARIKVGNGTAVFDATHTDIQGASNAEVAMDATFPSITNQTVSFKSTFASAVGNFAWEEAGVKNGAGAISATVKLLNRKVQTMGTKASGSSWVIQLDITVS